MRERAESELYACIATLDQLKKMYDMGAVDITSFRQESAGLISEVRGQIEEMRRLGLDPDGFLIAQRIPERFPDAASLLELGSPATQPLAGLTREQYLDYIGLAVLDVVTANSSKGIMGLAELIVEVVRRIPQSSPVSYSDVIEAVDMVAAHGLIPGIRTLKGGVKVVELRPLELRGDQAEVINLAASKGYVTIEEVMMELRWSRDHAVQVLGSLVDDGMAVLDSSYSAGKRYWFPGLRTRDSNAS